jgi:hypothetical protein
MISPAGVTGSQLDPPESPPAPLSCELLGESSPPLQAAVERKRTVHRPIQVA